MAKGEQLHAIVNRQILNTKELQIAEVVRELEWVKANKSLQLSAKGSFGIVGVVP